MLKLVFTALLVLFTASCSARKSSIKYLPPPPQPDEAEIELLDRSVRQWRSALQLCSGDIPWNDHAFLVGLFREVETDANTLKMFWIMRKPTEGAYRNLQNKLRELEGWMTIPPYGICKLRLYERNP